MSKKAFLMLASVLFFLMLGCANQPGVEEIEKIDEVKVFLNEHKNAEIESVKFAEEDFETVKAFAPLGCKQMPKKAYWKILVTAGADFAVVYLDADSMKEECFFVSVNNTGDPDNPDKTPTPFIGTGDKTCAQMGGEICSSMEYCEEELLAASDSQNCCPINCTKKAPTPTPTPSLTPTPIPSSTPTPIQTPFPTITSTPVSTSTPTPIPTTPPQPTADPCESISCSSSFKCVDGACVVKGCIDHVGVSCNSNEVCTGDYVFAGDSIACCLVSCNTVPQNTCLFLSRTASLSPGQKYPDLWSSSGLEAEIELIDVINPGAQMPLEISVKVYTVGGGSEGPKTVKTNENLSEKFNSLASDVILTGMRIQPDKKANFLIEGCLHPLYCNPISEQCSEESWNYIDLSFIGLSLSVTPNGATHLIEFEVSYANFEGGSVSPTAELYINGAKQDEIVIGNIGTASAKIASFSVPNEVFVAGDNAVEVRLDTLNEIIEDDESNNSDSITYHYEGPPE